MPAPAVVTPGDIRYGELVVGYNRRWVGTPESVRLAASTAQVADVVREAVATGKRLAVRSGGHCYADFVTGPETQVLLDVSNLNQVYYDPARRAFCVGAGTQLGRIYETLYRTWGVTIPGGICLTVGIAGHTSGGGFGLLTRKYGSVVDHLEAVEVVVVDAGGSVRTVIASRDPEDPDHDLWWAITGGGGGTFGVVTRFWFRSPDAEGSDPAQLLPRPPASVLVEPAGVPWQALDEDKFRTLIKNFSTWHERNSAPGDAGTALASILFARPKSGMGVGTLTQVDATVPGARELLADFGAAVTAGTGITMAMPPREVSWLASTKFVGGGTLLYDPTLRSAVKSAWMRRAFTDEQLGAVYRNLQRDDYPNPLGVFQLMSMGGKLNAVASEATAMPHRDSVLYAEFETFWTEAADDEVNLAWLRDLYADTFAATGGYPVPGEIVDGTNINNPDPDIVDPALNRSGVDWSTLYFGANYPRLQQVKARWDPTDFFRHSQSVRLPG
ncbi:MULTISPECIES: FAD-binding oxidoreductase [Amycolatopsis]|uniref:FAD-binding oxidoreductase n=1 Tax=Amycolatopsis TaxID=1813 RepID=UPI001E4F6AE3|nr:FAD-binding oxidoreductase [Amycolatopsis bullii]